MAGGSGMEGIPEVVAREQEVGQAKGTCQSEPQGRSRDEGRGGECHERGLGGLGKLSESMP